MTKAAALQNFFESFGLPVFEENSVPSGEAYPYITYNLSTGSFDEEIPLTASLWYRGYSWLKANAKSEEISAAIGRGGKMIPCDGGAIWVKRGSPFSQSMGDPEDDLIKRKYINITAEFFTAD